MKFVPLVKNNKVYVKIDKGNEKIEILVRLSGGAVVNLIPWIKKSIEFLNNDRFNQT
jgi:hypothetical protein